MHCTPVPLKIMLPVTSKTSGVMTVPGSQDASEMLTARELEAMLKISIKTIYSYVQRGLIPYVKIQSNVRFPREAILQWIEQQSYEPSMMRPNDHKSDSKKVLTSSRAR
jgi:excisionase family DNA binding protein